MCKAEKLQVRLFGLAGPKSGLCRQKEDQFRSIFSKRSPIRPRSDKAGLLGSIVGFELITKDMQACKKKMHLERQA